MSDKYGYIGIETLLNFCANTIDHAITPNDFMRLSRARTLTADRPKGEWIPVNERLPKTGVANQCLVTIEFPRTHSRGVYYGSRVVDNDWEYIDIEGTWQTLPGISKVLAWMPLPKPWKGKDDD